MHSRSAQTQHAACINEPALARQVCLCTAHNSFRDAKASARRFRAHKRSQSAVTLICLYDRTQAAQGCKTHQRTARALAARTLCRTAAARVQHAGSWLHAHVAVRCAVSDTVCNARKGRHSYAAAMARQDTYNGSYAVNSTREVINSRRDAVCVSKACTDCPQPRWRCARTRTDSNCRRVL